MGFDVTYYQEKSRTSSDVRDNNFGISLDRHEPQNKIILQALRLLKEAGASKIYNYLNDTTPPEKKNNRGERFPLQSVRRALTNMADKKQDIPRILFVREDKSEVYDNSTESIYRVNPNYESNSDQQKIF